jgi:pimeloyl-ACP methyl ester carboxylesterase
LLIAPLAILGFIVLVFVVAYMQYSRVFSARLSDATLFYDYFFSLYPEIHVQPFSCRAKERIEGVFLGYREYPKGLIVIVHGYGLNMENYFPQAEYFAKAGYCVILFDGKGVGRSAGSGICGLPQHILDLTAVLDYVESTPELSVLPLVLYGHSWGGYAANALFCHKSYPIKAIVSISAYNEPLGAIKARIRKRYGIFSGILTLPLALFQRVQFGRAAGYTSARGLARTDCPTFILHSKNDPILPFEDNFGKIKKTLAAKRNIRFWAVEGDNHNLGIPRDVSERCRRLQKQIRQTQDTSAQKELWELQILIDEDLLKCFVEYYDACLFGG